MQSAQGSQQLAEAWKLFLYRVNRCRNKMYAQYKDCKQSGKWKSDYEKLHKSDELLRYIVNARGAEEHTVQEIYEVTPGGIGIKPAVGNSMTIDHLVAVNGRLLEFKSREPVRVEFVPEKLVPSPITNRGVLYTVPTSHLGKTLKSSDIISLAEATIEFYENMSREAQEFFRDKAT